MRVLRTCVFLLLLSPLHNVSAQLLGVGFFGGPNISVARIDPATGAASVLVATDATSLSSAQPALDTTYGRVFFQTPNFLYTVSVRANTFSKVAFPNCCGPLLYDSVGAQLLGIGFFNGSATVNVARIDPTTGAATVLVTTDATGISSAQVALDSASRRIFFQVPNQLYTINLATSTYSKIAFSACCASLLYDPVGAQLLGIGFFAGSSHVGVARLDPATGAATVLVTTDATGFSSASPALDAEGRRAFFELPNQLYTVDLAATTFSKTLLPSCCPSLLFAPTNASIPMLGVPAQMLLLLALVFCGLLLLPRTASHS